ncbi:MAG: hypothetical protein ACI8RZ_005175 [Myxococcota bacterium]|jgi:hypothetical protein
MSSSSRFSNLLQHGVAVLTIAGLVGCVSRDVFEHAPTAGLEKDLSAAGFAEHPDHTVEGVIVVPHFREFSADFSVPRADIRLYAPASTTLWISRATLTSQSGVHTTVDINRLADLKKTVSGKSDVYWTGIRLFTTDNMDFPVMREQEGLTLYLWVGGSAEVPTSTELVFPITRRAVKDIRWPT